MERYMENRLTDLHMTGVRSQAFNKFIAFLAGLAVIFLLPYVHLGIIYYVWSSDKPKVNPQTCSCDCFDTVFRGRYEWPPSAYKHVYFNCTANTLKIWFVIVFGVLAAYEAVRYIVSVIRSRKLRIQMFALFLSSVYPHYYGWWGFFSYLNEDYYPQWYHQLFFSITELLSTAIVIHLCSLDNRIQPWKLLIILDINLVHVIVGGLDQFIINVIHKQGQNFEVFRDIGLMIPDIFHVLVAYFELTSLAERKATTVLRMFYREELLGSLLLVVLFSVLGKNV